MGKTLQSKGSYYVPLELKWCRLGVCLIQSNAELLSNPLLALGHLNSNHSFKIVMLAIVKMKYH
jgi:hypothetical protein